MIINALTLVVINIEGYSQLWVVSINWAKKSYHCCPLSITQIIANSLTIVNTWKRKIIILFCICNSYVIINTWFMVSVNLVQYLTNQNNHLILYLLELCYYQWINIKYDKTARTSPFVVYSFPLDWHNPIIIYLHNL